MDDLAKLFKAFSEPTRLRILALVMRHGAVCVCEVEALLGITQSKASRHLRYMANAGVLEWERDGATVMYRLPEHRGPELESLLGVLADLLARRVPEDPATESLVLVQLRDERKAGLAGAAGGH